MLKKTTLFIIIFLLTITAVSAGNNTTIIDNPIEQKIDGPTIEAIEGGDSNISFQNGFKGYCIEWGEHSAEKNDIFYIKNTSYTINKETHEDVSNYLKVFFICFYNEAQKDPITTQHMIWKFTDNKQFSRFNQTLYEKIVEKSNIVSIPDKGTFQINDTHKIIFEFQTFVSKYIQYQNYFGYKILFELIQNNSSGQITQKPFNNITQPSLNISFNKTNIGFNKTPIKKHEKYTVQSTSIHSNNSFGIKYCCGKSPQYLFYTIFFLLGLLFLNYKKK